jgi:DNA topoisomerase IA
MERILGPTSSSTGRSFILEKDTDMVERLWISSMEDEAILEGFSNLKPGTEYDALYEAALCRERVDWIVGINATRLFSTLYRQTLNVGRVMTPTLAMVVEREAAISETCYLELRVFV